MAASAGAGSARDNMDSSCRRRESNPHKRRQPSAAAAAGGRGASQRLARALHASRQQWPAEAVRAALVWRQTLFHSVPRLSPVMPLPVPPCDAIVDPDFARLVSGVQGLVSSIAQGLQQLQLDERRSADHLERQLQQLPVPEVESLCHELRRSSDQLIDNVNETLKRLVDANNDVGRAPLRLS